MATATKTEEKKPVSVTGTVPDSLKKITTPAAPLSTQQINDDDFENPSVGEVFGGSYARIELAENQVSPLMVYLKDTKLPLEKKVDVVENGVTTTQTITEIKTVAVCRIAADEKAPLLMLPISAIFMKHWKEANVNIGDKFKVKRYPDAVKKRGQGVGNKMQNFALKVYERAPVTV